MNPVLAVVALAVVVGAVVAVASRERRTVLWASSWPWSPRPSSPTRWPTPLGLAARLVGAVLAGYLLWIVARDRGSGRASPPDRRVADRLAGRGPGRGRRGGGRLRGARPGRPGRRTRAGQAAGFALAALAVAPVVDRSRRPAGRDRASCLLHRRGAPRPDGAGRHARRLEQLVTAAMLVVLSGARGGARRDARADGSGGYAFSDPSRPGASRARRPPARPVLTGGTR